MAINVYIAKNGQPTKSDIRLIERVKKVALAAAKRVGIGRKSVDIVLFYEQQWLQHFPANKIGAFTEHATSNVGKRPGIFLRKDFFDEVGYEEHMLDEVIGHEMLHMKIGASEKHGRVFTTAAKKCGVKPRANIKESEIEELKRRKQHGKKRA